MKNLSYYILAILILCSLNDTAHSIVLDTINKNMGYVSYVAEDLPQDENITEGCKCLGSGKITSPDGILSRPCPCITSGKECKCSKPKKPEGQSLKEGDCDLIRSLYPDDSPYRKFLPKQKGKELWCLKAFSDEKGKNWCAPCKLMEYEFGKMERTGWKIDKKGDLDGSGDFHIRLIDFDKFEGFPSYFFEVQKDKDGNILMDHEGHEKEELSLPTTVLWSDGKVKTVHVGFLNSFGLLKLWEEKPILKGIDDVPTK